MLCSEFFLRIKLRHSVKCTEMPIATESILICIVLVVAVVAALVIFCDKDHALLHCRGSRRGRNPPHTYSSALVLAPRLKAKDLENLRIGQAKMTEMMRVFDDICIRNAIEYFAIGGTLLGAVAYNDWIPWDGDLDVEILQSDWSRLEELLERELPDNMWLQTAKTDKHYRSWRPGYVMGKIRDLDSCYHHCQDGKRWHNGFMLDLNVYYFDKDNRLIIPDNTKVNYMYKSDVYPLQRTKFSTTTVNTPLNAEKYLQRNYNTNYRDMLPVLRRYPHEGMVDPHKSCPHHHALYPHMYDRNGARRSRTTVS